MSHALPLPHVDAALSNRSAGGKGRRSGRWQSPGLLVVLLVALNLRGSLAVVPPVLDDLRGELELSRSAASLLTTVPVLCFGLVATAAARLAARFRTDTVLTAAMAVLLGAIVVRSSWGLPGLMVGTVFIGLALTAGNVLVPVAVKRDFPTRTSRVTALYVTALTGGAALGSALSVPLAIDAGWGWRGSLAVWAAPAGLAVLACARRRAGQGTPSEIARAPAGPARTVWRSPVAWQLAAYMGLQSLLFYAVLTWLPAMLRDAGETPVNAGRALVVYTAVGVPGALLAPMFATGREQRLTLATPCVLWAVGLAGVLAAPSGWPAWMVVLGLGQGAGLSVALAQVPLRSTSSAMTARVSAMTQSAGYVVAAGGPWAMGAARDVLGSWRLPVLGLLVVCAVMLAAGLAAGRPDALVHESDLRLRWRKSAVRGAR